MLCLHQAPIKHPKLRNAIKTFAVIAQAPGPGPTFNGQHSYGHPEPAGGDEGVEDPQRLHAVEASTSNRGGSMRFRAM